jgi:hypothetical protein
MAKNTQSNMVLVEPMDRKVKRVSFGNIFLDFTKGLIEMTDIEFQRIKSTPLGDILECSAREARKPERKEEKKEV